MTGGNAGLEVVKNSQLGFAERLDPQRFSIPVLPDVVGKPESCKSGINLGRHVGSVANIYRLLSRFSTALVIEQFAKALIKIVVRALEPSEHK